MLCNCALFYQKSNNWTGHRARYNKSWLRAKNNGEASFPSVLGRILLPGTRASVRVCVCLRVISNSTSSPYSRIRGNQGFSLGLSQAFSFKRITKRKMDSQKEKQRSQPLPHCSPAKTSCEVSKITIQQKVTAE